jgi:NAD(P)H dehydrogenase (quinone)
MTKVLVLYYSAYGHIEKMAEAVAAGARETGASVDVKRVPELVPSEVAAKSGFKIDQAAAIAKVDDLVEYDAIVVGVGTRYGRMAAQMANFWDQTGSLWMKGALIGKIGAAFTSTGTQHGGQETTLVGMLASLMHHGMVVAGLPYSFEGQMRVDEVTGGTPYGASTVTGTDGARQPSVTELNGARFLGRHVANISKRLAARA